MNSDKVNSIAPQKAATAAFTVIDAIQKMPDEEKVIGLSACFLLMCKRFNVKPIDLIEKTDSIMRDNSKKMYWSCEFTAIEEYLEKEL